MNLKIGSYWILCYLEVYAMETIANKLPASVPTTPTPWQIKNEMDFAQLTTTNTFIDKTMLIKSLFNPPNYHYVTCPYGFGKTVNLDMVRRFLQFAIDNTTHKELENKTVNENYKLFKDPRLNLKIAKEEAFFERHFGEYPVLYLDFSNIHGETFPEMVVQIRKEVQNMYANYDFFYDFLLEKLNASTKFERYLGEQYFDKFSRLVRGEGSEEDIMESVTILSQLINRHFSKRAILLVDGLDVPIMNSLKKDMHYGDTYFFIQSIFSPSFTGVHRVGYALLTGVSRMMCTSAAEEIMIMKKFSLWDNHNYAEYFGFKEDEVCKLCDKYGIGTDERTKLRQYFGGYYILGKSIYVYNSRDVIDYLNNRTLTNYYLPPNARKELYETIEIPSVRKQVISYLAHKDMEYDVELNTTLRELYYFCRFNLRQPSDELYNPVKYANTYYLESGYLTLANAKKPEPVLRIANQKARIEFKKALQHFYLTYNLNLHEHLFAKGLCEFVEIENHDVNIIKRIREDVFSIFKNLIEGTLKPKPYIDQQEIFSILYGIITYNIERARINVPAREMNEQNLETMTNASLILPSLNGEILLMAKILYKSNITEAVRKIKSCVPIEGETKATIIKYLAISIDVNYEVEVVDLPNCYKNTSPVRW